ncbi:uncharacterized protein EV420DRAFT_1484315 [Desarmillaria tabescens]|uniref:Uncharacterized protein n=1 Tax=Armillaria tabescens TaxID=1929756 RepID=A0AA39MTX9_ARMTA|nr:uncharacterized protein EV420DRAFT_1484315 [Desarmillaria tabescens]KAK0445685.1 hypothetical protein EV420DRAFT_1484315 [Desarmillaria tabescens]
MCLTTSTTISDELEAANIVTELGRWDSQKFRLPLAYQCGHILQVAPGELGLGIYLSNPRRCGPRSEKHQYLRFKGEKKAHKPKRMPCTKLRDKWSPSTKYLNDEETNPADEK